MAIVYEKGWMKKRVEAAAKEYASWPSSVKDALKLRTKELKG